MSVRNNKLNSFLKKSLLIVLVVAFLASPRYLNQLTHASGPYDATNDGGITCTYAGTQYPSTHYNLTLQFHNGSSQPINTFISFQTNGNPSMETMSASGWNTV